MRKEYFGNVADDEKKVVKKFVDQNKESALKTRPKVSKPSLLHAHSHQ
jgi:hypothetical protein